MLRKLAAGTSAAVVAAGLAAAPAMASRLPKPGDTCDKGFVFGPPADVPQRLSSDRSCATVAPHPAPPDDTPHPPSTIAEAAPPAPSLPSGGTGESPEAPGGPGASGGGPGRRPSGDASTDDAPTLSPPEVPTGPAPTAAPADLAGPAETTRTPNGRPEASPAPLPVTGHDARPLAAAGGVNLVAAGLAFIGGARRRRRRQP
jgi:hypothetical protein